MAEAVRRFRETGGSDVVRRLIARPIRLDPPRRPERAAAEPIETPRPHPFAQRVPEPAAAIEAGTFEAADDAPDQAGDDDQDEDRTEADDLVERLRAEMALMKAILSAERAEAAALRARIERRPEPEPIGAEARATRDRWAGMVDRLLLSAR